MPDATHEDSTVHALRSDAAGNSPARDPAAEVSFYRARLKCLHAVSARLANFGSIEDCVPGLFSEVSALVPLRSAAWLEYRGDGRAHVTIWHEATTPRSRVVAAEEHACAAYRRSLGPGHRDPVIEVRVLPVAHAAIASDVPTTAAGNAAPRYIALPVASGGASIAGVLQLDHDDTTTADDREFLETIATQLASVLARQHSGADPAPAGAERGESATRAHREFVAVVSHDLRNPLSAILMSVALLLRSHKSGPGQKQLEVIKRSSERMNQLIQNVVDAASLDTGPLAVDPQPQNVLPMITESMRLLQGTAGSKSVRLETDVGTDVAGVLADRDRVVQCLSNVINTGLKFVTKGGAITVRVRLSARDVLFSVTDTGPGLSPDEIQQVFDQRWWLTRNASLSTGIGLAVAKGIVEAHGGRMWVTSTLGVGTTILFTLTPADAEAPRVNTTEPDSP